MSRSFAFVALLATLSVGALAGSRSQGNKPVIKQNRLTAV